MGKKGTQNIMQHVPRPGAGGSMIMETFWFVSDSSLTDTTRPFKGFQPDAPTPLESSARQEREGFAASVMTGGSKPDMFASLTFPLHEMVFSSSLCYLSHVVATSILMSGYVESFLPSYLPKLKGVLLNLVYDEQRTFYILQSKDDEFLVRRSFHSALSES